LIIFEYRIKKAVPSLLELMARLATEHTLGAPFEIANIRRLRQRLGLTLVLITKSARNVFLFVIGLMPSLMTTACWTCGDDLKVENASPSGDYVVATYVRNCGATTAYVTHLNIRRRSNSLRPGLDGAVRNGEIVSIKGNEAVKVTWLAPDHLQVEVDPADLIACLKSLNGIGVSCRSGR
jgi:hypothetical protein